MPDARLYHTRQTHFIRGTLNFNSPGSAVILSNAVPAGAVILRTIVCIPTAFNAGTTNTISVGFPGATTALVNATAAGSAAHTSTVAPVAQAVRAASSDLVATYAQTGTAATAGTAEILVEYVPA